MGDGDGRWGMGDGAVRFLDLIDCEFWFVGEPKGCHILS